MEKATRYCICLTFANFVYYLSLQTMHLLSIGNDQLTFLFCHTGLIAASCGQLDSILKGCESQKKTKNNGGVDVSTMKFSKNGNMKANGLSNDVYFNGNGLH